MPTAIYALGVPSIARLKDAKSTEEDHACKIIDAEEGYVHLPERPANSRQMNALGSDQVCMQRPLVLSPETNVAGSLALVGVFTYGQGLMLRRHDQRGSLVSLYVCPHQGDTTASCAFLFKCLPAPRRFDTYTKSNNPRLHGVDLRTGKTTGCSTQRCAMTRLQHKAGDKWQSLVVRYGSCVGVVISTDLQTMTGARTEGRMWHRQKA